MATQGFVRRLRARVAGAEIMRIEAGYRRRVGLLKVVLPVTAFVLLAMVMAWSSFQPGAPSFHLDFALSDYRVSGQDEVINPRFYGTDSKNQRYTVTAEVAMRPAGGGDQVFLVRPAADIAMANGEWMVLTADHGIYDRVAETLELSGAVSIYADQGFEVHTESAAIDLATGLASGEEAVRGQGPWGYLDAIGFTYRHAGQVFHFSGRPTLLLYAESENG